MGEIFSYHLIAPGERVLCALSGGADSMYLLCRLLEGAQQGGYQVGAAHYHHGIRAASQGEERFVREWCDSHHIPLYVGHGSVLQQAKEQGRGVEETARELRYEFLYDTARREGYTLIATGHHAGDNAETVLMHLIRGCSLKGLCGISPRRDRLIRPMLEVTREQVLQYLDDNQVPHVEDESNGDLAYTRNRMRSQVIPLLEEMNSQAVAHIAQAAARLREEETFLAEQAAALHGMALTDQRVEVDIRAILTAPRPLAMRKLAQGLGWCSIHPKKVYLEQLWRMMEQGSSGEVLYLPGYVARRRWDILVLTPIETCQAPQPMPLVEGDFPWGGWQVRCRTEPRPEGTPAGIWVQRGDYIIRSRQPRDKLKLPKRPTKTVKKLMIEHRIPADLRPSIPVVVQGDRVVAVMGLGVDEAYEPLPGQSALHITMTKETEDHA